MAIFRDKQPLLKKEIWLDKIFNQVEEASTFIKINQKLKLL